MIAESGKVTVLTAMRPGISNVILSE